jgi:hypothetical protein
MTRQQIGDAIFNGLGRSVSLRFIERVLDGDPFVFEAACNEDGEAARLVLRLATGRINA